MTVTVNQSTAVVDRYHTRCGEQGRAENQNRYHSVTCIGSVFNVRHGLMDLSVANCFSCDFREAGFEAGQRFLKRCHSYNWTRKFKMLKFFFMQNKGQNLIIILHLIMVKLILQVDVVK